MILVLKLIDECNIEGKTFVDLGSGVGQVCMMIAALANPSRYLCSCFSGSQSLTYSFRCFGIELMYHPARYAAQLLHRSVLPLPMKKLMFMFTSCVILQI
jgi:hypothetical protein